MISIIIPTYNEGKIVERTVRQFEALRSPHEVLVSDNVSEDDTMAIAKRCGARVVQMRSTQERGVSRARNNGAEAAKGEFLVFFDCDTTIGGNIDRFFKKALENFERDPNLIGLTVRYEVEPRFRTASDWMVLGLMNVWYFFLNNVLNVGMAAGKFQMVRTEAFRRTHGFDEKLRVGEDVELFGRLSKHGRVRLDWSLVVYNSGRRFHQLGAWTTLYHWIKNALVVWIFKKSDEKWDPIR